METSFAYFDSVVNLTLTKVDPDGENLVGFIMTAMDPNGHKIGTFMEDDKCREICVKNLKVF